MSLMRAAGEIGTTIFHPVGTAKMGLAQDPLAVVDERLRVHGLHGLACRRRVGDAAHHLRQHRFADDDDRREGGRNDPRRRESRLMWKEMQTLPPDGRQSETALMIARGVRRLLRARGFSSLTELSLTDGRRADIAAVNRDGEVLIVEVKSSPADFRADRKWRDYAACCDRLYFAISERTPAEPDAAGGGPDRRRSLWRGDRAGGRTAGAWPRPAAARFCCASPWPPPTGCTVWPIPGPRRNSGRRQHGDGAQKKRPPVGGLLIAVV